MSIWKFWERHKKQQTERPKTEPSEVNQMLENGSCGTARKAVLFLGNGATAQTFASVFQADGLDGRELNGGTGSNQCAAVLFPKEGEPLNADLFEAFQNEQNLFAGYYAAKKEQGTWLFYTTDQTWEKITADMPAKYLVKESADITRLLSQIQDMLILQAQWTDAQGNTRPCGYKMFTNQLMAHAFGGFEGHTYCNTLPAFEQAVKNGYRYFEVDLSYTSDGRLVVCHGWSKSNCTHTGFTYSPDFDDNMTYARIMKMKVHGQPIMDARELYKLVKKYPEFLFEIDFHNIAGEAVKERVRALLEDFQYDKEALDRLLIQAYTKQMYFDMDEIYHFKHYQYLIGKNIDQLDEIIQFSLEHGICVLAYRANLAKPINVRRINQAGIYVMCYTVTKNVAFAKKLLDSGVATLCTDYVTPKQLEQFKEEDGFGPWPFYVYYNSGTPDSAEGYTEKIETEDAVNGRILTGKVAKVPSGALEYKDQHIWKNDGQERLLPNLFYAEGKIFTGWKLRVSMDGKILWYCNDHCYHTKGDLGEKLQPVLFEEGAVIPKWTVVRDMKLIMVAEWR